MRKADLIKQVMAEFHWLASVDRFRLTRWLDKLYEEAYQAGRKDERKLQEIKEPWE